jgi:hypothetical protein
LSDASLRPALKKEATIEIFKGLTQSVEGYAFLDHIFREGLRFFDPYKVVYLYNLDSAQKL